VTKNSIERYRFCRKSRTSVEGSTWSVSTGRSINQSIKNF